MPNLDNAHDATGRSNKLCSDNRAHPEFPAASPFVTAVGATELNDAKRMSGEPAVCSLVDVAEGCAASGTEVGASFGGCKTTRQGLRFACIG